MVVKPSRVQSACWDTWTDNSHNDDRNDCDDNSWAFITMSYSAVSSDTNKKLMKGKTVKDEIQINSGINYGNKLPQKQFSVDYQGVLLTRCATVLF